MSPTAGVGCLAATLVAAAGLVGCGSSASPSQRLARCVESGQDKGGEALPVSDDAWTTFLRRACREALRENKLSAQGGVSEAEAKDIARRHPRVVYPLCEDLEFRARDQLQPDAAKYVPTPMLRRLGHHLCDIIISSGAAFDAENLKGAKANALSRQHPELLTPYCLAGAYAGFDKERRHVFTRSDLQKVMRRVCTTAVRRGYIRPSGGNNEAAVEALARQEALRAIRRGEIHPLSTS
jgi:hypothetical protein